MNKIQKGSIVAFSTQWLRSVGAGELRSLRGEVISLDQVNDELTATVIWGDGIHQRVNIKNLVLLD